MSDWKLKPVNSLGDIVTGSTPQTARKDFYGGDYYLISPAELDNGKYVRSAAKRLTKLGFNDELLAMERDLGDYVIVHELLHFSVPNHGKLWKCLMRAHLGEYEESERLLMTCVRNSGG